MNITRKGLTWTLFGCSIGLAMLPGAGAVAGASTTDVVTVPAGTGNGGTLNCSQLEALWVKAGGDPSKAFLAAEVARAESAGRQYATDNDGNGTVDRGYWQMNSINPGSSYDPMTNAEGAVALSKNGSDWGPWVTYQHGAEVGQC